MTEAINHMIGLVYIWQFTCVGVRALVDVLPNLAQPNILHFELETLTSTRAPGPSLVYTSSY